MAAQTLERGGYRPPGAAPVRGAAGRTSPPSHALDHAPADFDHDGESSSRGAHRRKRVPKHEVADVTGQLAIMIKSGLDLATALHSLSAQCERPVLAEVLDEVNELVLGGNTLSESLRQYPEVFDGAYCAMVAAAEASGRMAEVLDQLSQMQRNELRLRGSIRSMLTYPVLLTVISSSVIATLVVFVLPRFATIFAQYNMELPVLTQLLIGASVELKTRWWLWIPLAGGLLAGAAAWRLTDGGRRTIDGFLLRCPVIRNVTRPLFIGRTCRMLGLLLQSGVPLLEGLRLSRNAVNNRLYKDLLTDVADSVVNGRGMGPQLLEAQIVPRSAREMLLTAERTGNLSEVAILLGAYYEEDAENRMRQAVRISEPLITVVMGAIVAVVVLSVMLPIFDLSNIAGGGH